MTATATGTERVSEEQTAAVASSIVDARRA
jgi:hypothetical protein